MFKSFELYFLSIIRGKRKGILPNFFRALLRILSWFFQLIVSCRNWAFDHGWLCRYYPPVPIVISIGNIVAGGTGKTPLTLMLAQEFYADFVIAILSRGYRSEAEYLTSPVVLSRGEGPMHPATFCGDEPYLLSRSLPKAFVIVGKDRHQASNIAAKAGAHLILLDDGMQHRRLARDFEVIVIDAIDPFGQGYFLPRGFLRESLTSLSRAHLIVLNHVENAKQFASLKQLLSRYSGAPIIGTRMEVVQLLDFDGNPIENIKGKRVGLFCGIANPDYFQKTVQELGAEVVSTYFIPDHHQFNQNDLDSFANRCVEQNIEILLCTEKDRVKFSAVPLLTPLFAWVKTQLRLVEGGDDWKTFIQRAQRDLMRRM